MPQFMDYHEKLPDMPPEAAAQAKAMLEAGERNEFGSKGINVFFGTEGQAFCLSDSPDVESVIKSHEAMGIPIDAENIVEVNPLV